MSTFVEYYQGTESGCRNGGAKICAKENITPDT